MEEGEKVKFIVSKDIFDKFPDLSIGVVVAKSIDNIGTNEEIISLIREKETEIRQNFNAQTLSQNPRIDVWRKAYSSFGAKPKDNLSSVENLYKLVLRGVDIRHINKLVDIYNFISLKHMVPLGGENLDKIQGDIN